MADVHRIYSIKELKRIHCLSIMNRKIILKENHTCHCFNCLSKFDSSEITTWTDMGRTAICPKCGIDSILPETEEYPITKTVLKQMKNCWFAIN